MAVVAFKFGSPHKDIVILSMMQQVPTHTAYIIDNTHQLKKEILKEEIMMKHKQWFNGLHAL